MKNIICVIALLCCVAKLEAQEYIPTKNDLAVFPSTQTLVVLEDNPMSEFNIIMKRVMKEEWTMTPFDFITTKEFEKKRLSTKFSFIYISRVKFDKDKSNAVYKFISLLMGGSYSLNSMPDLCSIPLSYAGVGYEDYSYKLGIFLRFIQNHVKLLTEKPSLAGVNILEHYNKNMGDLKGKTLYLLASDMNKDVNTIEKIRKIYPGDVKLVTKDDIEQAITDKKDIVFLHKVGPQDSNMKDRVYKILIGADDARFYYFNYHTITEKEPDAFFGQGF